MFGPKKSMKSWLNHYDTESGSTYTLASGYENLRWRPAFRPGFRILIRIRIRMDRNYLSCWIWIRIQIADPDPDQGGQK